ncbi:hypothetical protein BRD17_09170 [Halobacteriales archaeon SW_7_68_16]|nr:MAG: hypothetical protein BRD17_09170 [Halobacteriales archaeon SW_7_68_16]
MPTDRDRALAARLVAHDRLVEVGVGTRIAVADLLADRGVAVTATDVVDRSVPATVGFVRDDVTAPDLDIYRGVEAIYALRCPPDLQPALARLGRRLDTTVLITTLGADPVVVPTTPECVGPTTVHRVTDR